MFTVSLSDLDMEESQEITLDDYPLLKEFFYLFLSEIPGMPPKRDINFQIDLVLGVEPICKAPYRMITQELQELRL